MRKPAFFILAFLSMTSALTFAQWSTDPANPGLVCDLVGHQTNVKAVPAGEGTVTVFWLDTRLSPGNYPKELYGQHYDADGYPMWEANGRVVLTHNNGIMDYDIIQNNNGNIVIGMLTKSAAAGAGDSLVFQMLDVTGESMWDPPLLAADAGATPNSILYLTGIKLLLVGSEFYALMEVTYYGGANGNRFIRFDNDGNLLSAFDGYPVGNQSYIGASGFAKVHDGSGDFYLYNSSGNGSGAALHCHRYDNMGTKIWGPVDVTQGTSGLTYQFGSTSDENGISFVWQGYGDGGIDLFSRRLTPGGAFAYGGNTINICVEDGEQGQFRMKQKDMYLYVTWADGRPGVDPGYADIYAQKLDTTGYLYWNPNGIEICSFNTYIPYPMMEILDDYSIIVDHQSTVAGFVAQKVDPDGSLPWGPDAYQISTTNFNPFYQMHTVFQSDNNTIVVWNKAASGGGSDGVYITRIDVATGVEETGNNSSFTIFPNPADDMVEVMLPNDLKAESISLFNVTGQLIETRNVSGNSSEERIGFNVSELPAGIYFVKVSNISNIQEQKIIIQ